MKQLRAWMLRLAGLFRSQRRERELADEIESNLQMHIEDNLRSGMTPEQARREAMLKLGGVGPTLQAYRERDTLPFIENLLQDARFAVRQLIKDPGFTFTAILMLALGICASVAIFAFVDAALVKPLPYRDTGRLVYVTESVPMIPRANLSYPDYLDWKKLNKVFDSLEISTQKGYALSTANGPQLVPGARISDGFFRTLGITPLLGRDFYTGEDLPEAPHTVILSYGAWQKWFNRRQDVAGQAVTLSGVSYTIVGVLPQKFSFAPIGSVDFWTTIHPEEGCDLKRGCHSMDGVARLKEGVSVKVAEADMKAIAQQLEQQYPDSNRGQGALVMPLTQLIVGTVRPILLTLLSGAALLLLIACFNVSSLLLARSDGRRREIAVRGALGASSARLICQFATEGLVLVAIGALLGVTLAAWAMKLMLALIPAAMLANMPCFEGLGLNAHLLVFSGVVSLLAVALFAITPTLRVPLSEIRDGLAEGSRGSAGITWRRFGANLVVLELATAVVLLVSAGLLSKSSYQLLHVELGFQPDHLATLVVSAPAANYGKDDQAATLGRQVVERITALPGVRSAAIGTVLPVSFNGNTTWIRIVGRPYHGEHNEVNERSVSSGYFATLQAKLLHGRYFTDAEDASKPGVVIINQTLARRYFPGEDPIGQKLGDTSLSPKSLAEIIGVVEDVKDGSLDSEIWPAVYYPFNQGPDTDFSVVVRTSQNEQSVLPVLTAAIHQINPDIVTNNEASMGERIITSPSAYLHRSSAWLVGGFATVAFLLSVVGLYGVIAYSVGRRTREIGVRMALGAQRGAVYQLILKEAGRLALLGIAIGMACSLAATTLLRDLLFGVKSWDTTTLAAVAVVLGAAALLASYLPARRAASINPLEALRAE